MGSVSFFYLCHICSSDWLIHWFADHGQIILLEPSQSTARFYVVDAYKVFFCSFYYDDFVLVSRKCSHCLTEDCFSSASTQIFPHFLLKFYVWTNYMPSLKMRKWITFHSPFSLVVVVLSQETFFSRLFKLDSLPWYFPAFWHSVCPLLLRGLRLTFAKHPSALIRCT